MASSRHSRSTYKSAAKSLKRVTAGGLEGVWDTKRRCVSLELPVGVTSIQMVVEGLDGVHTVDFSSFECAGSFVQWKDYDYPWKSSDFMLAREARHHGRRPPAASSQRTHGVVTSCALRIQLGCPSFEVDSACGADGHTPPRNFDIPHAPSLVTAGPNLTRPLQSAVGAHLQSVP